MLHKRHVEGKRMEHAEELESQLGHEGGGKWKLLWETRAPLGKAVSPRGEDDHVLPMARP